MLFKRNRLAAFKRGQTFLNGRLCPSQIVFFKFTLDNALVDELPGGLLDRRKIAGRDMGFEPGFLFGREGDRNALPMSQKAFALHPPNYRVELLQHFGLRASGAVKMALSSARASPYFI
ncbi:MAG: hypothetical protein AB7U61_06625 [Methylocystis sp.]